MGKALNILPKKKGIKMLNVVFKEMQSKAAMRYATYPLEWLK